MTVTFDHQYGNRAHPRIEFVESVQIQVHGENDFREVSALNLSPKGIFIECENPLPIGTRLDIQFAVLAGTVHAQESRVVWCRSAHRPNQEPQSALGPYGMGVVFEKMSGQSESIIQQVVENWIMDELENEPSEIESAILRALRSPRNPKKPR